MPTFKGRWTARVEQDFEIEAESEAEARALLDQEMAPGNVVELIDFETVEFEEVTDDEREDDDENVGYLSEISEAAHSHG